MLEVRVGEQKVENIGRRRQDPDLTPRIDFELGILVDPVSYRLRIPTGGSQHHDCCTTHGGFAERCAQHSFRARFVGKNRNDPTVLRLRRAMVSHRLTLDCGNPRAVAPLVQ